MPGSSHRFAHTSLVYVHVCEWCFLVRLFSNIQEDDFYHRHTLMSHSCRCNVLPFSLLYSFFFFFFFRFIFPSQCLSVCVCVLRLLLFTPSQKYFVSSCCEKFNYRHFSSWKFPALKICACNLNHIAITFYAHFVSCSQHTLAQPHAHIFHMHDFMCAYNFQINMNHNIKSTLQHQYQPSLWFHSTRKQ